MLLVCLVAPEVLNHPMEQRAIIIAPLHQFHEVVTVNGSLVIQANHNVAQHCLYLYSALRARILTLGRVQTRLTLLSLNRIVHLLCNFGCKDTNKRAKYQIIFEYFRAQGEILPNYRNNPGTFALSFTSKK